MSFCCYLLCLLLSFLASSCTAEPRRSELQTLLTIQRDWGNPVAFSSWKPNSSDSLAHCNWAGITCNERGQVTALSFSKFNLSGPVPASICSLEHLLYIVVSFNNLTGEFPTVLYSCSALQVLDLSNNGFSCSLPGDINRLSSKMQEIDLSNNGFSGSVPSAFGAFSKLMTLSLYANRFSGSYPVTAISHLVELKMLMLGNNPFRPGPFPDEFCNLKNLELLHMSAMNLTGGIPDCLSAHTKLTELFMAQNKLTGPILASIGWLPDLIYIDMSDNNLSGSLPPELCKHSPLSVLSVENNLLSGVFPDSLGECGTLSLIEVANNSFVGEFPKKIWSFPQLSSVSLENNDFSGTLPAELSPSIENIRIANNRFSGDVPRIGVRLTQFSARNNRFSGQLR